jgi:hypothetical protein
VSGGDRIQVVAGGTTYLFDDDFFSDVLEGKTSLPTTLSQFLTLQGITGEKLDTVLRELALLAED